MWIHPEWPNCSAGFSTLLEFSVRYMGFPHIGKRLLSTVLSRQMESEMMFATLLGSGVQPASLAAQFQGRKSSTRFTG